MKEQSWLEEGWFYHSHAWSTLHEIIKNIPYKAKSGFDFGAGTGIAASVIQAVRPDIKMQVADIAEESCDFWFKRGLTGFIINPESQGILPYSEKTFDFTMSSHVLEHLELDEAIFAVRELFRITATYGKIIIVVPDGDVHFYDHKIIFNRAVLKDLITQSLYDKYYQCNSYPQYHPHLNNLFAVIERLS